MLNKIINFPSSILKYGLKTCTEQWNNQNHKQSMENTIILTIITYYVDYRSDAHNESRHEAVLCDASELLAREIVVTLKYAVLHRKRH